MFYLFLSIIFTSWWALSYKLALKRNCSSLGVIVTALGTATALTFLWKLATFSFQFNYLSAMIGVIGGVALFIAVVTYFVVIKGGARLGISWAIISLSMIIPTSFSVFLWKEVPTFFQALGLLLAITSICLLGKVKPANAHLTGREWALLSTAFFLTGVVSVTVKLIPALGLEKFKLTYILFLYGGAFISALMINRIRRELPTLKEIKVGVGMGISGVANIFFLLLALENLTGTIAFPVKACGNIVLTVFITYLVWGEKINRKETIGLSLALLAIVFMNI